MRCAKYLPIMSDEEFLRIANGIKAGKLIVHEAINEYAIYESMSKINWDIQVSQSPNTYQLFLQSLNPIMFLSKAHLITQDYCYINIGKEILESWIRYKETSPKNAFIWYDHGTALRVENIIYFMLTMKQSIEAIEKEFSHKITMLVEEHAAYLFEDKNYTAKHNHGIFQDRALIFCADYLQNENSQRYVEKAKERLEEQVRFGFNSEIIHVENSPGYQTGVVSLLCEIGHCLEQYGDGEGIQLLKKTRKSNEFLMHMMKPNGILAEIGDTSSLFTPKEALISMYLDDPQLLYAANQGKEGLVPVEQMKVYPKTGYYLYRSSWEKRDFEQATWLMFKAGYESKTHKHADDLSFMFYSKGMDLFVDPGWYNYVYGDAYREYLISSRAHNTVIVDDKTYSTTAANAYKTGMLHADMNHSMYQYVLGFNKMYEGVQIDRHFYYLKEDAILLYDNIVSEQEHVYSQLFHTSEVLEILDAAGDEIVLEVKGTAYRVRIRQLLKNTALKVYKGDEEHQYGHISREINHIAEIYTLKFDQKGKNVDFLTLITIEDDTGKCMAFDKFLYNTKERKLEIVQSKELAYKLEFKPRERLKIVDYSTQQSKDGKFNFAINMNIKQGTQYAWYVLKEKNGDIEYKSAYSGEFTFMYQFKEKENYMVKVYIKSKEGEITRGIMTQIKYTEGKGHEAINGSIDQFQLKIEPAKVEQVTKNKYNFEIPYTYFWKIAVKWYIYRNGGYYKMIRTGNKLEYEFQVPGTYVVMYYLRTLSGEEEFWSIPPITIL